MSLTEKIKDFLSSDTLSTKKQKEQKKEQLASKAFDTKKGGKASRDTGKHSNSVTPTKKATPALKTTTSTGVPKASKEKGVSATKVTADNFNGTGKSTSQNGYIKLKHGAGLYNDDDMGFSNLKAGSVRMSDSQKGNNNSKPKGTLDIIKMANIQSKHMDKTVQNTINAHNASVIKGEAKEKLKGDITNALEGIGINSSAIRGLADKTFDKIKETPRKPDKADMAILSGLKNPKTSQQTIDKLEKYGKKSFGSENSHVLEVNPISKSLVPRQDKAADRENALVDAWESTKKSETRTKPITVKSVNGKAPKGLYPGDKVVTNAGTYTIKAVLSDGSYITDATETFKDASGKTWEKAPDTTQTKYNTYEYNDPKEKRDITYKRQGVFEHIGDAAKQFLNDDSKSKEYKQKQAETYSKVEQEFLNDKESSKYTGKNHGLLSLMGKGTESEWSPKMGLLSSATQMQKDMYNYTYAKHGKKAAKEYLESLEYTQLNPKNAANVQKMIETDVKSSPVIASIASVGANIALPQVAAVRNAIQGVKNATGMFKYKPIDANDSLNAISSYSSKVRGAVSEKIKNPALRVGYNAVMSMADMAAQAATLGGAGGNASKFVTLSMSTVSANDTVLDTLSRGGTQQQAFTNGLINGALEYVSESPAVEGVFNVGRGIRPVKDVKSFAISTLRQMGIEAGGEGFANITQNLADQIIMGDKSNFGQTVKYYEQEGKSHKEAVKQATMDMYVKQTAEAMATGALAGGVMGGTASAFNTASAGRNINSNTAYAKDLARTANEIGLGGQYAETAKEINKGHNVSSLDAANLKGAIQDYYQKKTYDDIARFYNYVGLEAPHRLATAFGKASSRDETGYNNQKFTDAWLDKSTDILMQIEQYKADPKNTDLKANIKEYLENSNALLYSGVLSEDGQFAAAVRARANEVINGIPASAAGQNIVSNDSDLYAEDTENANAENNNADIDTQSTDGETSNARVAAQSVREDAAPVIDITDDVVPLSESASEGAESNNATTGKVASTGKTATQNVTTAAEPTVEPAAQSAVSEIQPVNVKEPKSEPKSQPKKEPKTVDDYVVGQKKGRTVTYHKSAIKENGSQLAQKAVQAVGSNFDYDIVRESPKSNTVLLIKVDDFDRYTEPTIVAEYDIDFDKNGNIKKQQENKYAVGMIIPDKSEYVSPSYTGFDVAAQKAHENKWKNALDKNGEHIRYDSSKISNPEYFYDTFGDIVSRGERSEDISESETANEQEQNNADLNGYSIDESPDGSTFTVYDPEGYYEDEFKSRKEAEEYVRSLSNEGKKDKVDEKKEVKSETETEKESKTESEDISDSEGINKENRQDSANTDNKTEESEDLDSEPFIEDEYELIDWEDLDEGEAEPVAKKIDMDKIRSNRAIASEMKRAFDVLYDTPKSANQMGKLVKEIYEQVVEDGYYDLSAAADSFRYEIENNRYIGEDLRTPEEKEFYQAVTHSNFKVDDAVKSEITDYGDWQKANKNIILKSGKNGTQSIDNFYSNVKSEYPDVFYGNSKITGEATTEGDMLVELVAAAREIQKKMYTREGDIGTAFEGLDTEDISLIWADKLGEVLSIAKPEKKSKKAKTEGKTNESENKKKPDGKSKESTPAEKSNGKSKSGTEKEDGRTVEKGRAESKDTAKEKVSEAEVKTNSEEPTILKARGKKQQSAPNKDNPLRGSLNDLKARQNYGKTDEAIRSIKAENRAVAENIGSIIKEIGKKMHVNIYAKRYRNMGRNTLGWFDNMHSQIHTQEKEQLGITIHELGHKLDKDFGLNGSAGVQDMLNGVPGLKQEMEQRGYTPEEMEFETIADFVWKYLSEPDVAWEMGSYARNRNFYETFELALDKKTLKDIKAIRADILAFTTKNTTERMRGQVRTREEVRAEDRLHVHDLKTPNRAMGKLIQGFDRAYGNFQENFIDSTWAASKVVKDIEKVSGHKLTPKENLQLALEFAGSNASVTDTLITRGFIKPNGELTGRESFASIIKETENQGAKAGRTSKKNAFNDFALYLIARQSIDRERMGQVTMSQDATGGDNIAAYEQLIRDMDSKYGDLFEKQSDAVYEWYDAFMRSWMVETGLLTEEKYEMMRNMYPHYVPMFRVMDTRHANGQVSKGVNPLKHNSLKGSTREIYNPIENIMIQVNNIVKAYHNNEVAATIHRLWTSEDAAVQSGIAQFVTKEEVKLQKQQVDTTEIKGRLENKVFKHIFNDVWSAEQRGEWSRMSDEEKAQLKAELANHDIIDDVIDDTITQFVPTDNGLDEDVVVALIDGEKHYYRILDEYLAQAITAVQPSIELLQHIGKLTRVFSALTTAKNPIFALSNGIRDFQHGWVYADTEHWYQNFTYPAEWTVALVQSFKNEFGIKHQSDMYKQYKSTTGFDSKYMADADTLGTVMAQMRRSKNPLIWATRFVEKLNGAVESAPRYVAYKRKIKAGEDVIVAGKAAREATVNFNRKGKLTKQAGQIVPFIGAAVAGINQFTELMSHPWKNKAKLARAMATQAIPAVFLAFANAGWFGDDDDKRKEYDELSEYTKNNYWVFKWGNTWLKLPRDREVSAVFGTLFQNIVLSELYPDERDSETTKEFISYMLSQFKPSVAPTGWALIQARNNKTWYGSNIVSNAQEDLLGTPETYMEITDESTSEIANWIAGIINKGPEAMREALNVLATPKGVDYAIDQLTGVFGDIALPLTRPAERWAGLGESLKAKYTFNEDKSSRYTSEAYDIKDKLTALNAADKLTDEEKEWLTAFSKTMSKSSGDDPDYKTVGDYFADIRAYRNDLNMSYSDRAAKMNKAYEHIADMTYDLVRAYKGGGTPQGSYAEKIIPSDIDSVGFTPETYTAAFNEVSKGDKSAKKLALASNTELTDEQKEYLSEDIVGVRYDGYAKAYKKLADAGVTAEQITKAYNTSKNYNTDKAKALNIVANGGDNAALIAVAVAGTSDDKLDHMTKVYQSAVKSGVTADMYESIMDSALTISKAAGKKGITKNGLISACKKAGYSSMQTMYIKQMYNSRWR